MADTIAAPNNKPVAFKGDVAREPSGVDAPVQKAASPKRIRKHANRAIKRGMISAKAASRHLKGV